MATSGVPGDIRRSVLGFALRRGIRDAVKLVPTIAEEAAIAEKDSSFSASRSWARFPIHTRITLSYTRSGQANYIHGQGGDICEGGMSVFIPLDLDVGLELKLSFNMPYRSSPVQLKAVVRNRARFRYGLEFTDLTPEQKEMIEAACKTLSLMQ